MQQRLQTLLQAVDIMRMPLARFYDSLSDEQKARFDAMGSPENRLATTGQASTDPQAQCERQLPVWPTDEIERVVRPVGAQETKLRAVEQAAARAADIVRAACPSELARTPPGRIDAVRKRLEAMLQGVRTVRPALEDFYASLDNDQRARFNTLGRQLSSSRG
jgi:hypothetical protein